MQQKKLNMKYSIQELEHLRRVRAIGMDNRWYDDLHVSDRSNFEDQTTIFLEWLNKMERLGKIKELLSTMSVV